MTHQSFVCSLSRMLPLVIASLQGCSVLDPTGEWRGREVAEAIARSAKSSKVGAQQVRQFDLPPEEPVAGITAGLTETGARKSASGTPSVMKSERFAMPTNLGAPMVRDSSPGVDDGRGSTPAEKTGSDGVQGSPIVALANPRDIAISSASPELMEGVFREGERLYQEGRYADAEPVFSYLTRLHPEQPRAWLRLGNIRHRRGELGLARQAYERAARFNPAATHSPRDLEAQGKAIANLAILAVEIAEVSHANRGSLIGEAAAEGASAASSARGLSGVTRNATVRNDAAVVEVIQGKPMR